MGRFDRDRHQKELAIRYCVARGHVPCLEVIVSSKADLSDSIETLTDLDVLGLEFITDGGFRRTIFDCKSGKMSAINRAFWAAGVLKYTSCDEAFVILKTKAVNNHRLSALQLGIDIHDEFSFLDFGRTFDIAFNKDSTYQSSIDRWNEVYDCYTRSEWSQELYLLGRNIVPLTLQPWSPFRKLIAELRRIKGYIDPSNNGHVALYFDILAAFFVLWSVLGRDIRRFFQPGMTKSDFDKILRYYIWGGKESFSIRQDLSPKNGDGISRPLELPAWEKLVSFSGIIIAAPQDLFGCVNICRNISIRTLCGINELHDNDLKNAVKLNKRARQFILSMNDYIIAGCSLPSDFGRRVESIVSEL